jgi:ABC-type Fe3+/spermidine/putrescine transport system ATPase subunit
MKAIIKIQELSKKYASNAVESLSNISFDLQKGRALAIMGESGSGKTTLLKLIAGLEDATNGSIIFQNKKIIGPKDKLVPGTAGIKLINQNLSLPPSQSIAASIAYELKHYTKEYKDGQVEELLTLFQLQPHRHKTPSELSGGQKQRALFAWAIADAPALLLMDEPLSHLDENFKNYIYEKVFKILKKSKTTIIFATHQLSEVYRLADEMLMIKDGKKLQYDTPTTIYAKPNNAEVATLSGSCNLLEARKFLALLPADILGKKVSSKATFVIRPKDILLKKEREGMLNAIVLSVTFMGEYYETVVKVMPLLNSKYSPQLTVHTLHLPLYEVNQQMELGFDVSNWHLIG